MLLLAGLGFGVAFGSQRILDRQKVKTVVRSVQTNTDAAIKKGQFVRKPLTSRPVDNPRTSAINLHEVGKLMREVEMALVQNRLAEAETFLIRALTLRPDYAPAQAELAKLYLQTAREPKAEALYEELVTANSDAEYYSELGLTYFVQGKYIEACAAYQEALNLDPDTPERSASLAHACMYAKRFQEAAALFEKAAAHLDKNTEILNLLAECYMKLGKPMQAEHIFKQVQALDPYNEEVKQRLSSFG